MRRVLAPILLVAMLLALAGCGDSSSENNTYVRKVDAAQTQFATSVSRISQAITPTSTDRQDRRTLARFQDAVGRVVRQLRAIDVPAEVRDEHGRLIVAMERFGTDIEQASASLRTPTIESLQKARRQIGAATTAVDARIRAAIAAINAELGA